MSQITSRGDTVYECDVCKRRIRTPLNKYSLDVIQRCTITHTCPGKLHRVTQSKDINNTPALTPSVTGLQDWFQRRVLYTHTQTIESTEWLIPHNLGTNPSVQIFQRQLDNGEPVFVETSNVDIITVDTNTNIARFVSPTAGIAQCLSHSSQNTTNPNLHQPTLEIASDIQVTSAREITIATTSPVALIAIDMVVSDPTTNTLTTITVTDIDNVPSSATPWVGTNKIFAGGKIYTVRSFSTSGLQIANGAQIYISKVYDVADINPSNPTPLFPNILLLGTAPFSAQDRNLTQIINISAINQQQPELYYSSGEVFCNPTVIKTIYPPIFIVE